MIRMMLINLAMLSMLFIGGCSDARAFLNKTSTSKTEKHPRSLQTSRKHSTKPHKRKNKRKRTSHKRKFHSEIGKKRDISKSH